MGTKVNFSNKWLSLALHICAWSIIFFFPILLESNVDRHPVQITLQQRQAFFNLKLTNFLLLIIFFYINSYFFIPKFFLVKKYAAYILVLLISYIAVFLMHRLFFHIFSDEVFFHFNRAIMATFPAFVMMVLASTAFRIVIEQWKMEKNYLEKNQETLKTELSFLRSQISPHFIFNILNNIVALVRLKSDQLEPTVIKLSELLRYMLYETDGKKISIEKEVDYLQSYIDLQQQRFGRKVQLNFQKDVDNSAIEIEPMLLIPFIENAFKHGVGTIQNPFINIELKTKNNELNFIVENKFNKDFEEEKDKSSGIGLNNVSRRLRLLYPDKHRLLITENNNLFKVNLWIKFN